jgi:hypothetical protein
MTLFWNSGAIARYSGNSADSAKKRIASRRELRAAISPLLRRYSALFKTIIKANRTKSSPYIFVTDYCNNDLQQAIIQETFFF